MRGTCRADLYSGCTTHMVAFHHVLLRNHQVCQFSTWCEKKFCPRPRWPCRSTCHKSNLIALGSGVATKQLLTFGSPTSSPVSVSTHLSRVGDLLFCVVQERPVHDGDIPFLFFAVLYDISKIHCWSNCRAPFDSLSRHRRLSILTSSSEVVMKREAS